MSAFDSIGLSAGNQTRSFMTALARTIKARHGSAIHLYCSTAQNADYFRKADTEGLFTSINSMRLFAETCREPVKDEQAVMEMARHYEAMLGTTYNVFAVGNRHVGRGFALGGYHHPRSRVSENTSYAQMVNAFNQTFQFWENEIRIKGLTMGLNGTLEFIAMLRAFNLPFRGLVGSRFKNLYFWGHSERYDTPDVARAFETIHVAADAHVELPTPFFHEEEHRREFMREVGVIPMMTRLAGDVARYGYYHLRGYDKAKGYYLGQNMKYRVKRRAAIREMSGPGMTRLADLEGKRFAFYPLHTEPETAVSVLSPEYFYQQAAIAAVARDLPAGVILAVKETIHGAGRRPDNFYDQIRDLKNVTFLHMMEYGLEVVKKCSVLVTITGTAGFEASVLGKPVISFGRRNIWNFLPHVRVVTDEIRLKDHLREALDGTIDLRRARADGARYLEAVVSTSFDMRDFSYYRPEEFQAESVEDAYRNLCESVSVAPRAGALSSAAAS